MNRSLKLPLLMALALGSGHALAMDLGQIRVKSALGQPLLAEIPVQQATPAELQQLSVRLASGDASSGGSSIPLHVSVVDGGKLIRITSDTAVNDPFLDLLLESQKNVHEFTILLDPPGSNRALPLAQLPPPTRTSKSAAASAPSHTRPSEHASEQEANGRFGPIERGQNLSTVARQTAPAGVDLNQMLLALKQANPDAFYHDNINALKAGAVLRIPSKADAEAIAVAAAAAEVRRQNGDWRNGTVGSAPTTVADAGTRASTSSSPTSAAGSASDHLALVPAKQGGKAGGTSGSGEGGNALRQDLQRSQETLASLQQQDEDLKSRLKDLTDINGKNQRLLALKDNEIAELQQKLAAARKAAGMPAEAVPAATAVAAAAANAPAQPAAKPAGAGTAAAPSASSTTASNAAAKAASVPGSASTAPAVASKPAPVATSAKTAPLKPSASKPAPVNEEPWYSQLWVEALGGVILLLVLLGLLRRRGAAKPAAAPSRTAPSLADRFEASPPLGSTGDAELDALLDQLAEHPDDIGLHLELVSLYYDRRDVEHFEAAAEAMHAHVSDVHQEEWQEVVHMGEELAPSHPLFAQHGAMSADELEAHHEFDIDRYAAEPVAAPAPAPTPAGPPPMPAGPVKVSEYSYSFDITPVHDNAAKSADEAGSDSAHHAAEPAEAAHAPAPSWHFDEPEMQVQPAGHDIEPREFSDDPVDTKLDLARAYMDMGDPEGARAMLEEVLHEGSQMQRDVAKRLLDDLH
ncbi:FimV/HubP family polar landmark protein [Rhodanobacter sp. DHG33]|uniref:FimV/HubP family polar landmark protein n=1 Tax=Rhodanobacter sp. DHG33 TaxID=2775921 RepID=UPI00177FA6C1|nr:FimV/HubP family polar landmark protein [Rhodanobacter sp. DHG33]MBD8900268.1 fimbrial protein FimV [Rhodanobacter sp. DHG33]